MEDIEKKWDELVLRLEKEMDDELTLKTILFLIGVQELGQGIKDFDKEEKTWIFHIAICKVLAPLGYYQFESIDEDGWPHYKELKNIEELGAKSQKNLMQKAIIKYFE